MKLTVGVTGHRDLLKSEEAGLRLKVKELFLQLSHDYPDVVLQIISPLAEGSDQLVADVALEMGLAVIAPLPMQQHEYEKDFQTNESLRRFRSLLEQTEVITLPPVVRDASDLAATEVNERNLQYAQLGVFLSNHCQILIALWDGISTDELGGTSAVMRYHLTGVMVGFSVDDDSPNLLANNENDLVYHIMCSRENAKLDLKPYRNALETSWLASHFEETREDCIPDEYALMLRRLNDFASDVKEYDSKIKKQGKSLISDTKELQLPKGITLVDTLYQRADMLAIIFQRRVSFGLFVTYLLAALMGLTFIVYSEFGGPEVLLYFFLLFFGIGLAVYRYTGVSQWHRKYLDYRALAEGLRVQFYWNLAGVVETQTAVFAYDNFLQKQDVDLGWIRQVMRSASLVRDRNNPPDVKWLEWVVRHWVGITPEDQGQLAYYQNKVTEKSVTLKRTTLISRVSLWLGLLFTVMVAIFASSISVNQKHVLMILIGLLPLIAGIRDAYSHKKAEKELIKQYRFMSTIFSNASKLLERSNDIAFQRKVLKALGNACLEEHAEWILMHRERPLEHHGF